MRLVWLMTVLGICGLAATSGAQFQPKERSALDSALMIAGVTESKLNYVRRPLEPSSIPLVNLALDKPIEGMEALMSLQSKSDQPLSTILRSLCEDAFGDTLAVTPKEQITQSDLKTDLPVELQKPVLDLVAAVATSNAAIRQALSGLNAEEKRQLIETLPQLAAMGAQETFEFVSKPRLTIADFSAKMAKVNLKMIRSAAAILADRIAQISPKIRAARGSIKPFGLIKFTIKGVTVELADESNTVHDLKNTQLCIDLGGKNSYTGRYGAGIGYTGVVLDYGDGSTVTGADATIGVGILGIGIAEFEGKSTVLRGRNLCFGVGMGGVGIVSVAHATVMEAHAISEGVGFEGVGLCDLSPENDRAVVGFLGQGAGLPGGIGWLVNPAGNDQYIAGGPLADPRVPRGHYAMAQGFGAGIETVAGGLPGGLGILTDREGNDSYTAGTECHGFGTWGGVGVLGDLAGDDTYTAQGFAQADAQQFGGGFLFDLEGNDMLTCRYGPGQGSSTQGSTVGLVARGGDDLFAGRDVQGPTATENSVVFWVSNGGISRQSGQLPGEPAEPSSLTFEVRLGAESTVSEKSVHNFARSSRRSGRTVFAPETVSDRQGAVADLPQPGSITATVEEIDDLFAKATNPYSTDASAAGRKLVGIGLPGLKRILATQMRELNQRGAEVLGLVVGKLGAGGSGELSKGFNSLSPAAQVGALRVASIAGAKEFVPLVKSLSESAYLAVELCEYVKTIESVEAAKELQFLALSEDPRVRHAAAEMICALAGKGDELALQGLVRSDDLGIRRLATAALVRFPEVGFTFAKSLLLTGREGDSILGIDLLGSIGTEDAVRLAGSGLNSSAATVKLAALKAVDGRVPAAYRSRVLDLQRDTDPTVALVARSISLGR